VYYGLSVRRRLGAQAATLPAPRTMKTGFLEKLIERLDRIDPKSLQTHFLRLAEERGLLETIFQSIQEGILVIDGTGRLNYANRTAEQFLGFSLETAKGRPVAAYLKEIDWDSILAFDPSAWSKLISHEIEVAYPVHRFLHFYIVPLAVRRAGEDGAVIIMRDVTHDRRHEASLLESERLNTIKLLAAGVAHEIGNPLNALHIHLQLLEREIRALPEPQAASLGELVAVAKTEVVRLDSIITQFLRALRPAKPEFAPAQIDELLRETLVLLRQEIQDRNIAVEIDCPKALPSIPADRNQIKQVFFNIIRNAFQAMPHGGRLQIILTVKDPYLSILFRDTGVGIKPEDFARIFDPYYSTKPDGSGLGLLIVQRIVQEHGGQIKVVTSAEQGTDFAILLPLSERRTRLLKAPPTRELETLPAGAQPPGADGERTAP